MELPPPYDARYRAVVEHLSANFQPSRQLWPVNARLASWLILELAIIMLVAVTFPRPQLFARLHQFPYAIELAAFLLVGTLAGIFAFRHAIPGREVSKAEAALLCILGASAVLSVLWEPIGRNVGALSFVLAGLQCVACTIALAALPWVALFWAVRRGVPLAPELTGGLIGAASFSFAFTASRLGCPIDDVRHILLWHVLPVLFGVVLSTLAGIAWLRRKREPLVCPHFAAGWHQPHRSENTGSHH